MVKYFINKKLRNKRALWSIMLSPLFIPSPQKSLFCSTLFVKKYKRNFLCCRYNKASCNSTLKLIMRVYSVEPQKILLLLSITYEKKSSNKIENDFSHKKRRGKNEMGIEIFALFYFSHDVFCVM